MKRNLRRIIVKNQPKNPKNNNPKNNKGKYLLYAILLGMIIGLAFIVGTAVGFYANKLYGPTVESCETISCPAEYQCKPGTVCDFQKCEVCITKPRMWGVSNG